MIAFPPERRYKLEFVILASEDRATRQSCASAPSRFHLRLAFQTQGIVGKIWASPQKSLLLYTEVKCCFKAYLLFFSFLQKSKTKRQWGFDTATLLSFWITCPSQTQAYNVNHHTLQKHNIPSWGHSSTADLCYWTNYANFHVFTLIKNIVPWGHGSMADAATNCLDITSKSTVTQLLTQDTISELKE